MLNIIYLFIKFDTKSQIDGNPFKKNVSMEIFLNYIKLCVQKKILHIFYLFYLIQSRKLVASVVVFGLS